MAKQFEFREEARQQLMAGIDKLARAVGVTLGPNGRNVLLDKEFGPPQVCSDGVTIAKEIELQQPFQNMGAQLLKQAASKTNDDVGDGTTTATILAQNILKNGFRNVAAGADPMSLKQGIDNAVKSIKEELENMAQQVESQSQIEQVAVLSSHDQKMGLLIAEVIEKVGDDGVVTVGESKGLDYEVEYVEGMQIDRGYLSPHFVTNQDKMTCEIEQPYVLLTSEKISSATDIVPLLETLGPISKNLVIIAEDIEGQALSTLVVNKMRRTINCLAVKAPAFGDRRKAILEDLGILLGATVISGDTGRKLESVVVSDLGQCQKIIATKDDTTFVEGTGSQSAINGRIGQIKKQAMDTTSDYDREKLEERSAKLSGGVAVIKVGAATEVELTEKKQRLEDALSATRAAMDGGILPGGGTALIRAAQTVAASITQDGDKHTGAQIVLRSVEMPVMLLSENAGFSGAVVVDTIKKGHGDWGFNAETNRYGSMLEMGILDPAKVTRVALENAASIAGMILTTESIMTELDPPKLPAPYDD